MFWRLHGIPAMGGSFFLLLIFAVFISGIFMWLGASLAGIKRATLGRAIVVSLSGTAIVWIVGSLFALFLMPAGSLLGFLLSLLLVLLATRALFDTSFGKALLAWVFFLVGQIVAGLVVGFLFFRGISTFVL